jgi:hypothetical protein
LRWVQFETGASHGALINPANMIYISIRNTSIHVKHENNGGIFEYITHHGIC